MGKQQYMNTIMEREVNKSIHHYMRQMYNHFIKYISKHLRTKFEDQVTQEMGNKPPIGKYANT